MTDDLTPAQKTDLAERIATILEKGNYTSILDEYCRRSEANMVAYICRTIAKALRTGDTGEISRWVKE